MFERKNRKGLEPKYYHKMILIIVLTSVVLSILVALISGPQIAEKFFLWHVEITDNNDKVHLSIFFVEKAILYVFLFTMAVYVLLNIILMSLIKFLVLEPMVSDLQNEKRSFRKDILTILSNKEIIPYIPVSASAYKINEELYTYTKDSDT